MRNFNGTDSGNEDLVINQNKTGQAGSEVSSILKHHSLENPALDLANRSISTIPPSLFTLPHIQVSLNVIFSCRIGSFTTGFSLLVSQFFRIYGWHQFSHRLFSELLSNLECGFT